MRSSSLSTLWLGRFASVAVLASAVTACGAEYADEPPPNVAGAEPAPPGDPDGAMEEPEQAPPAAPPPAAAPGAPPGTPPPPPAAAPAAPTAAPAPPATPPPPVAPAAPGTASGPVYTTDDSAIGQWVYTSPYGWVWMPYEQSYTYVTPAQDSAYEYVYYPSVGWEWISAPWVIGIGPRPYWGRVGPVRFAWYAHPWFRPHRVYYHRGYYGHPYSRGGGRRGRRW
jgi:hypothetical protein